MDFHISAADQEWLAEIKNRIASSRGKAAFFRFYEGSSIWQQSVAKLGDEEVLK